MPRVVTKRKRKSRSVTIHTNSTEQEVEQWLKSVSDERLRRLNVLVNAQGQARGWSPYWSE